VTTPPPSQESRRPLEPVRNVTSQLTANLISPSGNNQPGTPDQPSFTKNTQELGTDQPSANKDTQGFDQGAGGEKPSSVKSGQKPIVETTMKIGDNGPTIEVVNGGVSRQGLPESRSQGWQAQITSMRCSASCIRGYRQSMPV